MRLDWKERTPLQASSTPRMPVSISILLPSTKARIPPRLSRAPVTFAASRLSSIVSQRSRSKGHGTEARAKKKAKAKWRLHGVPPASCVMAKLAAKAATAINHMIIRQSGEDSSRRLAPAVAHHNRTSRRKRRTQEPPAAAGSGRVPQRRAKIHAAKAGTIQPCEYWSSVSQVKERR